MPQHVPTIEWTEDALRVRQHIFEFWAEHGHGPNLRDVHEALGLDRRQILQAYKQLQLGIIITCDEDTQNGNLLKAPPFSSYPSQVAAYVDGEFHSWVGCASECIAFSHMPPFKDRDVRLESYCICCLEPIVLESKNFELQSVTPDTAMLHVSLSPWDWNNVDMKTMCDAMNFVIDAEHAERFEKQSSRRGVLANMEQAKGFVTFTADQRMWDYHWPGQTMMPALVIKTFQRLGCDTTAWDG
jgi:hypothetical protein